MNQRAMDAMNDFDAAHGGINSAVLIDGIYYFPDGATRSGMEMRGPPVGRDAELTKLRQKVFIQETLLRRETEQFDELKDRLLNGPNAHFDAEANEKRLEQLHEAVVERQKLLKAAQHQLETHAPGYVPSEIQRQRAEAEARNEERRQAFRSRIKQYEV